MSDDEFTTTTELPGLEAMGGDTVAHLNMRDWMRDAIEAKGARFTGGGFMADECDLDIELQGHHYNIRIKPITRLTSEIRETQRDLKIVPLLEPVDRGQKDDH